MICCNVEQKTVSDELGIGEAVDGDIGECV